jgi:hypothetical protein
MFCLQLVLISQMSFANDQQASRANVEQAERAQIKQAYTDWVKAVETAKGNATQVAALYAPNAILLPTLSPEIKIKLSNDTSQELYDFTQADIREYFIAFTKLKDIQATTEQLYTQIFNDVAINTGLYTFEYLDEQGNKIDVPARFTFVYEKIGDKWLIINHHSSYLPEAAH